MLNLLVWHGICYIDTCNQTTDNMTKEQANELMTRIENSKFFKRYGYDGHWMSGSSTIVYPITHWCPSKEIVIQIDPLADHSGMTNSFKKLYNELAKDFDITDWHYDKSDGSCPQTYTIWYN